MFNDWDELELSNKGYKVSAVLFSIVLIIIIILFVLGLPRVASGISIWAGSTLAPAFSQYHVNNHRKEYNETVRLINERHKKEREEYNGYHNKNRI